MQDRKVKVWLGMGTAVLVGNAALSVGAFADEAGMQAHNALHKTQVVQAGEGGEGGESGAIVGLSSETALIARLVMMRGHLRAGRDDLAAGDRETAALHFAHPQAELYQEIAKLLPVVKAGPFVDKLQATVNLMNAKADRESIEASVEESVKSIDRVIALAVGRDRQAGARLAQASVAVLKAAASEYGASIKGGKFTNVEEYQDARGFVLELRRTVTKYRDALRKVDSRGYDSLLRDIDAMRAALGPARPPAQPVLAPGAMFGLSSRAELDASIFQRTGAGGEKGEGGEGGEGGEKAKH